jgi:hypothetical protein
MGDREGAKAAMDTANELERQRRESGRMTTPTGETANVPGSLRADALRKEQEGITTSNLALKEEVNQEFKQGLNAKQLARSLRNTLFTHSFDEQGRDVWTPSTNLGVYSKQAAHIAAALQYLGISPEAAKQFTGVDLSKLEEAKKLEYAIAGVQAANAMPGGAGAVHTQIFQEGQDASPNVNMTPAAIQAMLDLIERRADIQMRSPESIRDANGNPLPFDTDYRISRQKWQADERNMWNLPQIETPPIDISDIHPQAIQDLKDHPETAKFFDETFHRPGAAAQILSAGKGKKP